MIRGINNRENQYAMLWGKKVRLRWFYTVSGRGDKLYIVKIVLVGIFGAL
jgi:hypothetical protein